MLTYLYGWDITIFKECLQVGLQRVLFDDGVRLL
jgi:hypothetical protein